MASKVKIDGALTGVPLNMRLGFNDPRYTTKGPGFKFVKGIAVEVPAGAPTITHGEAEFREMMQSRKLGATLTNTAIGAGAGAGGGAGAGAGAGAAATTLPRYVADARTVLRFETYFLEAVHESPTEKARTRRITLLYYVEDDTLQLNERAVENSGIPQGTFVKRHKCPNQAGGGYVSYADLVVGGNVRIYGRTFRIVSCDAATRDWYDARGMPQPNDSDAPVDAYSTLRETLKGRDTGADGEIFRGKKTNPLKRFMEASLGNASNVQRCGQSDALRKFLDNDRKVLRFFGVWDDRDTVYGDRLFFRIHYFLADDTVEVLEVHQPNSGRDRFPALLKRQRVPRDVRYNDDRARGVEDDNGDNDYYDADDLCVGSTINVLGRSVLLYDADAFTHQWYREVKGLDMKDAVIDVSEPAPSAPVIKPPAYAGFGTEEDSLSSFMFLTPKVPRPDFAKLMANDKKMLRFTGHLYKASPIDKARQFIITWYLADDSIAVYEHAQRNSGIVGGKWLSRTRAKTIAVPGGKAGEFLTKGHLYVGAVLTLKGHRFELDAADEYTLRVMEGTDDVWPLSKLENVISLLKKKMQGVSAKARNMFRSIDKDHSGFITIHEFQSALTGWGLDVPRAAMVTIYRHYDKSGDGRISYLEFCDAFLDKEDAGGVRAKEQLSKSASGDLGDYAKVLDSVELNDKEQAHLRDIVAKFTFVFETRQAEQAVTAEFRKFDTNKDNTVDRGEFRAALTQEADSEDRIFCLPAKDVAMLEKVFFAPGQQKLDYGGFMATLSRYAQSMAALAP